MNKEEFYDTEIAPGLLKLAKLCTANDMDIGFVATVEYNDEGCIASTSALSPSNSMPIRFMHKLSQCIQDGQLNVDAFIMSLMNHAEKHGHSSIILSQLGVPTKPVNCPPNQDAGK